jgi:anti-sigma factor RsiW
MYICEHLKQLLHPYLDSELDVKEAIRVQTHLNECSPCRNLFRHEKEFLDNCRESYSHGIAGPPLELRRDVLRRLGLEIQGNARGRFFAWSAPIWAATAVVVFVIALAASLSSNTNQEKDIPGLVRSAVDNHEGYLRHRVALEFVGSDPDRASHWFQERVGFPVQLPPEVAQDLKMQGATVVPFGDLQLAFLAYELGGEKVSLVVTASSDSDRLLGGGGINFKGRTFHQTAYKGYHTLSWNHRGLSYVLVSNDSERVKQACVICHGSPTGIQLIEEFRDKKI